MRPSVNPYMRNGAVNARRAAITEGTASRVFSPLSREGGALAICGERSMGKTSLLTYIANPPREWRSDYFKGHIFVAFNAMDSDVLSPGGFWRRAIAELERMVPENAKPLKERCQALLARCTTDPGIDARHFAEILDVAGGTRRRIALVLDDFDTLIRTDKESIGTTRVFLQGLRSLLTRPVNKANIVLATRSSLEQVSKSLIVENASPFSNGFTLHRLQLFRDQELAHVFRWVEEAGQPPFSKEEMEYITFLSGRHPQLVQIAAAEMFDRRVDTGAPLADLVSVGEQFRSVARSLFQTLWNHAADVERILLMFIALRKLEGKLPERQYSLKDLATIMSQRERELVELTDRGLLIRTAGEPPDWELFSPMFGWWVLKEIESGDPDQLGDYRKVWGNLVTQRDAKRLGQVVDFARAHKDVIESVGKTALRITGAAGQFGIGGTS